MDHMCSQCNLLKYRDSQAALSNGDRASKSATSCASRSASLLGRSASLLGRSASLLGRSVSLLGRSASLLGRSASNSNGEPINVIHTRVPFPLHLHRIHNIIARYFCVGGAFQESIDPLSVNHNESSLGSMSFK